MKASRARRQAVKKYLVSGLILVGLIIAFSAFPAKVFAAGLILDAELRFTYEDNVIGILSDQQRGVSSGGGTMMSMHQMGQPGMGHPGSPPYLGSGSSTTRSRADYYATIFAEAGVYTDLGSDLSVFAKGFADHSSYNTYTDLDATIGGVSTGVVASLSNSVTALGSVAGKIKRFGDSQRDSTAYVGALSLKEKLLPSFWLREYGEYEKNNADNAVFTYEGTKVGIVAGYNPAQRTFLAASYSYLEQKFDEPSGSKIRTNTFSLNAEQSISRSWAIGGEYDLLLSHENITGSSTTDNIFSLALKYSY